MKLNIASTLAFLPLITVISATEVAGFLKNTLGNSDCTNIRLDDGHVLRTTCTDPEYKNRTDVSLDLNGCFANYLGTLNHAYNGNFAGSCSGCHMDKTKLVCECSKDESGCTKHTEYELSEWHTVQVNPGGILACDFNSGLEKRAKDKEARAFVA
ncbi:uncharacterized protein GGS25DRAFT_449447 [Hypoxylon fragiforme]|uniref:uncharacterized protein n=1 Tax=Hypoxylon fragiforme TaxID=63214 RepID=UPI0020C6F446|nr:uncharacterized protein GGS25DRAFT_449447 [Hypoxylon fragiforme]KAI2604136.1 hypothetical protein GGS25DRAFT_449447 [Hypoxylon fragiforme]